ncbi:MAG: NfeD family protein [Bacteroidota bacterium]
MSLRSVFEGMFSRKPEEDSDPRGGSDPDERRPSMLGRRVKTLTALKNSGYVLIDGQRVEVISRSGFVQANTYVVIVGKKMGRWEVEILSESKRKDRR